MDTIKVLKEVKFSGDRKGRLLGYQSNKLFGAEILSAKGFVRAFGLTLDEAINKAVTNFSSRAA